MDVCAINRPFDDMGVGRNLAEGNAVWAIVRLCKASGWEILWSDAMEAEFKRAGDDKLLAKVRGLLPMATTTLPTTNEIKTRAASFGAGGIEGYDGLHLALAEKYATVFLTTDIRLLKKATRLYAGLDWDARLKVRSMNPVEWLREMAND
jgi:predicted nucleic acid-binding protein